ncbi:FAD/NAD(P)-binding domain-containing protein [Auricularia subglabra TFB-10046 SS5]|nr:FAD/NAD(P)-binding domain-containing protein [Auricularia subglabra TFB-10046 SS5]
MSLPNFSEVVIVGAGPAGLACALVLASKGVPFVLVDALNEGQNNSRACVVHASALEASSRSWITALDTVGIADRIVEGGIQMEDLVSLNAHEQRFSRVNMSRTLARYTKFPFALLIAQCDVEELLRKRLAEAGGTVHWNKRVEKMEDTTEGLHLTLEGGHTIRASYVVATDGARSTIRAHAGIEFLDPHTGRTSVPDEHGLQFILGDLHIAEPLPPSVRTDRIFACFDKHGITLFIPMKGSALHAGPPDSHFFRIAASVKPSAAQHAPDAVYLQRLLDARGPGRTSTDPDDKPRIVAVHESSRYRVRWGLASQYVKRMPLSASWVALAGDAAHIHSPAGGQGMNLGLCDGVRLGRAISTALAAPETARDELEKYEKLRRPAAQAVIKTSGALTAWYSSGILHRPWVQRLLISALGFLQAMPGVQSMMAWRLSGLVYREK